MNDKGIITYFSGLSATIRSVRDIQKVYDPIMAFNFNSLNFLRPGENKYSEILAFFLNPLQVHGQGDLFLKLFLKHCGLDDKVSVTDFTSIKCECEHVIIDNQRRIDLLITFGNNEFGIGIENKVWAIDQKEQLKDYNTYLDKNFKNYCLIYLTPYQKEPSKESIDPVLSKVLYKKGALKFIGYSDIIIDCVHEWAVNCQAERVRVFLSDFEQYLKQEFLGQTFMEENQTIVNHALASAESLEVAFATANALNKIKEKILDYFKLQIKDIADNNGLVFNENIGLNNLYTGFWFRKGTWKFARITFQFTAKNANEFRYGISLMGKDNDNVDAPIEIPEQLVDLILISFNKVKEKNDWWLFSEYFEGSYRNWNNQSQPWIDIQNGDMKKRIDSIVKDLIKKADGLEM